MIAVGATTKSAIQARRGETRSHPAVPGSRRGPWACCASWVAPCLMRCFARAQPRSGPGLQIGDQLVDRDRRLADVAERLELRISRWIARRVRTLLRRKQVSRLQV